MYIWIWGQRWGWVREGQVGGWVTDNYVRPWGKGRGYPVWFAFFPPSVHVFKLHWFCLILLCVFTAFQLYSSESRRIAWKNKKSEKERGKKGVLSIFSVLSSSPPTHCKQGGVLCGGGEIMCKCVSISNVLLLLICNDRPYAHTRTSFPLRQTKGASQGHGVTTIPNTCGAGRPPHTPPTPHTSKSHDTGDRQAFLMLRKATFYNTHWCMFFSSLSFNATILHSSNSEVIWKLLEDGGIPLL